MAQAAEQDNRVQIPDGTAAVSAEGTLGESQSLDIFREGEAPVQVCNHLHRHKSEDLRISYLPFPACIRETPLSRKTAVAPF